MTWLAIGSYLCFALASLILTVIDLRRRRLPDRVVIPSLAVTAVLFLGDTLLSGDWLRLLMAFGAALAVFACYLLLALASPRGIGGGDVKLAPLIGIMLGFVSWAAVLVGVFAGFLLGGAFGLLLILLGGAKRRTTLPFGPFMLLGAWIGILWGDRIGAALLGTGVS